MNAIHQIETNASKFKDKKRKLWMLGLVIPNIANAAMLGYQFGPKRTKKFFAAAGPIALHGLIPLIDKFLGEDSENPPEEAIAELEADPYYAKIVNLYIPLQYIANIYGNYIASRDSTPLSDRILIGTTLGLVNGVAINTAHELSHKSGKLQHYLSHLCLAPTGYNHFRIEHPYGHHLRVATPEDPASSQFGESFWKFWPRTVSGSFKSAIEIETRRLERKGLSFWSIHNELLQGWAMSAVYHGLMLKVFGKNIIPTQITQSLYGITLFEAVNYMEHYGLKRQKLENGRYERTMPVHSWNNNSLFSNILLYQLQRHSDHHAYPTRSYQALRHYENVPQLPAGYTGLFLQVFIPSYWFSIMDKQVINYYQGDIDKINVYEPAKETVLQKYNQYFQAQATEAL
ncbi:alkane 1-monooxygenase [Acinetobacter junii]|uniref:alkane 1-monooxygenase n=1 Tax=Acinetobacter junii TaxID=40215 RepID=UPI00100FAF60|nr:alkane 1-monooxygenase [Acinetobacter junii]RXS89888.1 alkane 1-monooxygenase [Acinetobacter junii]